MANLTLTLTHDEIVDFLHLKSTDTDLPVYEMACYGVSHKLLDGAMDVQSVYLVKMEF